MVKDIRPSDTCPKELYELLSKELVHDAVKVVRDKEKKTLTVKPIGIITRQYDKGLTMKEVPTAVRFVLRCLKFIHDKSFVHRDVRWSNLIRTFKNRDDGPELVFPSN